MLYTLYLLAYAHILHICAIDYGISLFFSPFRSVTLSKEKEQLMKQYAYDDRGPLLSNCKCSYSTYNN